MGCLLGLLTGCMSLLPPIILRCLTRTHSEVLPVSLFLLRVLSRCSRRSLCTRALFLASSPESGSGAVGVSPSAEPSVLGTSPATPAPTPASAGASPLAVATDSHATSGLKGVVVGSGDLKVAPSASTSNVKRAPTDSKDPKEQRRLKELDVWKRQTEWKVAQGVVSHKVSVAVEQQPKKVVLYKFTFKPLLGSASASGAAAASNAGPDITVFRRYDDVIWLRSAVMKLFPGVYLTLAFCGVGVTPDLWLCAVCCMCAGLWFCNLASKGFMSTVDAAFLADRREDTERLLTQMVSVGQGQGLVVQSDPFIQFVSAVGVDAFDKGLVLAHS
jgi:hypothetical protein